MGFESEAPFDKIIVTAGAPTITEKLIEQLSPNGKLVIPVGDKKEQKMILVYKNNDGTYQRKELKSFNFVPFIGQNAW
jgi:protein-L-isoaspartate(D-aspartate) O-methyltransferase